jgi:tetratricopeptide (TPR) repeat protein
MVCESIEERDLIAQYLLGRLSDADRDAFEAHAFECDRCLNALETMRILQAELRRQRGAIPHEIPTVRRAPWRWKGPLAAAAAILIVTVGVGWRLRHTLAPNSPTVRTAHPATAPLSATPGASTPSSIASSDSILALARVEPPRYVPFTVRGSDDERARRFDRAMQDYSNGDYQRAATGLRRVLEDDSEDVEANFFLGIALLMTDDVDGAIECLRTTIAHGDSPFRQVASLDLAKALMRKRDLAASERELNRTIVLQGSHRSEASDLLRRLQLLRRSSR